MSVGQLGDLMLGCVWVSARGTEGERAGCWWCCVGWVLGVLCVLGVLGLTELLTLSAAPEVVKGDPVGSAADVWGVGVLTYIM